MMPGGNGFSVLRKLKASTETQLIPVIVISTLQDPALPEQAQELGAEAFLPMPVHSPDLRDLLNRLLDKSDEPPSVGPPSSKN